MLVCITGGIGAGKSVVSHIVAAMGYAVYDTDSRARQLMDNSPEIIDAVARRIGRGTVVEGRIDRARLAETVFNDPELLRMLNAIVHGAVIADIKRWYAGRKESMAFVETAIMYQSGLHRIVDTVWEVTAPEPLRVARVMARNNLTDSQVRARIASQTFRPAQPHPRVSTIVNDGMAPLLPQILDLLQTSVF